MTLEGSMNKSIRTPWSDDFPDTVIDRKLGEATGHTMYEAAKSGDAVAALELVEDLISDEAVYALIQVIAGRDVALIPVLAEEAVGRNKIPLATALKLSSILKCNCKLNVLQLTKVSRTGGDGWHRIASQPQFGILSGEGIKSTGCYLLIDDTQTQGGTFAALRGYIEKNGGTVIGCYALTGKQYSVQLRLSEEILLELRSKYAELEPWFVQTFGYDFASLTQWEAKFILNSRKSTHEVRAAIFTARNE